MAFNLFFIYIVTVVEYWLNGKLELVHLRQSRAKREPFTTEINQSSLPGFKELLQTEWFITNWVVYYKLGGLLQTGWFITNWVVYYKLSGLLQTEWFITNWVVYYKLGGLLQTEWFITN